MTSLTKEDLKKVSYLDTASLDGRVVNLMPLWDGERWHQWVPSPQGLVEIRPVDAVEGDYVGRNAAHQADLLIPFVELMWQRASYPEICPLIQAICEDFHNMGTSVAKLRHFFDSRSRLTAGDATRFVATELEYIVILTRTVFDLLQETISRLWKDNVRLNDLELEKFRRGHKLPDSFSRMTLRDKQAIRTAEEIERDFGLPSVLATEYANHAEFFCQLRNTRDAIVHGGNRIGLIFPTERGFCVDSREAPFSLFVTWHDTHRYNENLVSVLPWVASVVLNTINACNRLMLVVASVIKFPPEIAPGYRVFVRGPSTPALFNVLQIHEGGSPWWTEL